VALLAGTIREKEAQVVRAIRTVGGEKGGRISFEGRSGGGKKSRRREKEVSG